MALIGCMNQRIEQLLPILHLVVRFNIEAELEWGDRVRSVSDSA
jgi:hypothetical protein